MEEIEEKAISQTDIRPKEWKRLVDDIFAVMKKDAWFLPFMTNSTKLTNTLLLQ